VIVERFLVGERLAADGTLQVLVAAVVPHAHR
jgi:hypothetical protein